MDIPEFTVIIPEFTVDIPEFTVDIPDDGPGREKPDSL